INSILIVGLGKKQEFTNEAARIIMGKVVAIVKEHGLNEFAIIPFVKLDEQSLTSIVEGIHLSNYAFTKYKKIEESDKNKLVQVQLVSITKSNEFKTWLHRASVICKAVNFVRDISNLPPNFCSPSDLAKLTLESCDKVTNIRIISRDEMQTLGLSAILS